MTYLPKRPIDTSALEAVLKPTASASGLPNAHYIDADMFEAEKQAVFSRSWAGIGFAKDLPEPGYAMPLTFLGEPLLLLRDRQGIVRVFFNVCRHRGMILVEEEGPIRGAIRCPYHSWCYDLDGALKAMPHVGGPGHNAHADMDRDTLGLVEVRSHVWRGVVFVNLSGDAEPFEAANAGLIDRWADFEQPLYHAGAESSFTLQVETNWKLAVENYCESYHLPWIHPGLNSYSRLEDHYHIEADDDFSGQGTLVYRQLEGDGGQTFPDAADLPQKWDTAAEYITVFPNVLMGVHRDHSFAIILEPQGPTATAEHIEICYHQPEACAPDYADLRARNAAQWKEVFEEDIFVVEGMQRGRMASGFDGGRFSPAMDTPTHLFHRWIASRLLERTAA